MYGQEKIKPYSEKGGKEEQVAAMFDSVARSYDFLNHALSFGLDRLWRRKAVGALKKHKPANILDIATGTADFAILAARMLRPEKITGVDISEGMLGIGRDKVRREKLSGVISLVKGSCMKLPFADNSFDAVTAAYGVRNFESLDRGLQEMLRVVRRGGRLVIAELSAPRKFPMKQLFRLYSRTVMHAAGKAVARDSRAYDYLPATMQAFPPKPQMQDALRRAGFRNVRCRSSLSGINTIYEAEK